MGIQELRAQIDGLLGRTHECRCGRRHTVHTRVVEISPGAIRQVGELAEEHFGPGRVLVVADPNTFAAAGEATLEILARGRAVESYVVAPESGEPVGDELHVAQVRERLADGYCAAVAVGSGTINDLVKLAARQCRLPYGVVATAASMNGYTSAIAAIYAEGLKRTLPATPPVWVVADLDVLAAAPVEMTRAGLADLMSKPVSTADWRSAAFVLGEYYCPFCAEIAGRAEEACRANAAAIGAGDPEALALLIAGLILSGLSMAMAGSSSPASGGEHLISHIWDMRAMLAGRPHALHGFQAGVGTLMTASLWQLLRGLPRPGPCRIDEIVAERASWEEEVELIRRRLGPLAEAAIAEYGRKRPDDQELLRRLNLLASRWDEFWGEVGPMLRPVAELRDTLVAASAPATVGELGYSETDGRQAFRDARFIRSRYTVFDLAVDLGVLEGLAERALALSGVLG